jgi:hypothetical protein
VPLQHQQRAGVRQPKSGHTAAFLGKIKPNYAVIPSGKPDEGTNGGFAIRVKLPSRPSRTRWAAPVQTRRLG